MKSVLASDTTKSSRTLAQSIAKQMVQEPLEILKTATSQVSGIEKPMPRENYSPDQNSDNQSKIIAHQNELQDKAKSGRLMEAFEKELDDIRKQNIFKDLQQKISEGLEVPLEDYPELSMEQKQVLKAQMEATKFQKQQAEYSQSQESGSLFGTAKPNRKMGAGQRGQKAEAEKQQTRVEKPVPPSG